MRKHVFLISFPDSGLNEMQLIYDERLEFFPQNAQSCSYCYELKAI